MRHLLNLASHHLQGLPLAVLYLTDGCNSRCVTCDIWRNPRRNMPMDRAQHIIDSADELGMRWVLLSGGEAMQHPQWHEIAGGFRAKGIFTMLLTNGILLNKDAQKVIDSVDECIISLDAGTAATYEAIRGVDAFDLIFEGIAQLRAAGTTVATRTTLQRANYAEMPLIIEKTLAADVNRISFLTVDVSSNIAFGTRFAPDVDLPLMAAHEPPADALRAEDIPRFETVLDEVEARFVDAFSTGRIAESPAKLRGMADYFRAVIGQGEFTPPRCNAPHISAVIESDGTLRPCYFLPAWGKLGDHSLKAALNDPAAKQLRAAYKNGQRPECERCVCPLYKGPRGLLGM